MVAPEPPNDKPEEDGNGDGLDRSEELFAGDHGDHDWGNIDEVFYMGVCMRRATWGSGCPVRVIWCPQTGLGDDATTARFTPSSTFVPSLSASLLTVLFFFNTVPVVYSLLNSRFTPCWLVSARRH